MKRTINFDMDGTLADLYAQMGWLEDLEAYNARPYKNAKPMVNMRALSFKLKRLQKMGYEINIISWLSKCSNSEYDQKVEKAKKDWLNKHLKSVNFNNIYILKYGTPKENYSNKAAILFDDEKPNRDKWKGQAYEPNEILEILDLLIKTSMR